MKSRLRDIRNERGLTQDSLAKMVGVDRSMISKIESGNSCSIDVGLRISKALGVAFEEIFGDFQEPDKPITA